MGKVSKISYVDASWSPWIGCTKVSEACQNCYAEAWAKRCGRDFTTVTRASDANFYAPRKWLAGQIDRVFVCELSDFFHRDADIWRQSAWLVMKSCCGFKFLICTKRPERIAQCRETLTGWPLPWVWLGVTAENQERADERIPILLGTPAAFRFVSIEPLLSAIDLSSWLGYYPVHEDESGDGRPSDGRSAQRNAGGGLGGSSLASEEKGMGSLEAGSSGPTVQKSAGREPDEPGIPTASLDDGRRPRTCDGTSNSLSSEVRRDPPGVDHQSQKRDQERQQAREPRSGHILREYETRISDRSQGRVRGKEPSKQIDHVRSRGDSSFVRQGRDDTGAIGGEIQRDLSDDLRHCEGRAPDDRAGASSRLYTPQAAHQPQSESQGAVHKPDLIIVGAESGPNRRDCKVEWIEDIVDQCRAANVPVYVKQGSHLHPGQQGDIPDHLWRIKEVPA